MTGSRVLLVDDEAAIRFGIRDFLESHGYLVAEADSVRSAEQAFVDARPDVAIIDYLLPDGNALELLPRLRETSPEVPLIILTAHGSIDLAVRAIKEGAEQFLTKPVELSTLRILIQRLLEHDRTRRNEFAGRSGKARKEIDPFLGTSPAIRALHEEARKVLRAESPILIQGETGTGKGVLARWLHRSGPRAEEPFVDLNCGGLTREFLETELFGHEKGAFTGAATSKPGLFEIAHRGILFLDEIGDVDLQVQPKLLKVLDEARFRRLGEVRERSVDVRLIAATHQDLPRLQREGRFRGDLYFRISAIPLRVPALRERVEDIPALADRLLAQLGSDLGRVGAYLADSAYRTLQAYPWPGNVRELRNVLERAVLLSGSERLDENDLRFESHHRDLPEESMAPATLRDVEQRHIARILAAERGHVERAARRLGIPRSSLYQKIKRFGIAVDSRNQTAHLDPGPRRSGSH